MQLLHPIVLAWQELIGGFSLANFDSPPHLRVHLRVHMINLNHLTHFTNWFT